MDGARFDAWTRRRFGIAAGGLASALFGLNADDNPEAAAKKKKKKPRCRNLGQACTASGNKVCCKNQELSCQAPLGSSKQKCCLRGKATCQTSDDCCSGECTDNKCACKSIGEACGGFDIACCSLNCKGTGDTATCQSA